MWCGVVWATGGWDRGVLIVVGLGQSGRLQKNLMVGRRCWCGELLIAVLGKMDVDGHLGAFLRRSEKGVLFALFESSSCRSVRKRSNMGFQKTWMVGRRSGDGGLPITVVGKIERGGYLGAFLRRSERGMRE